MVKISGKKLHYAAAKNWTIPPIAYLRDLASCQALNGILRQNDFLGHKQSICGKYVLRPSKGKWDKAKLLGEDVYHNREKYLRRDEKSDRQHLKKRINNKRVHMLLKQDLLNQLNGE